ncbi:hypothetical protein EFA69_14495 [Rufibacter immobilis]|uniref:Uncharacterized protein n=1 Tax=Rufibacter immobilis TaxID=1348778 RepID=A0A3M9MPB5_9BACT|nr:hypothetical protein [Rufibacter immobilis]RNI27351.1 hypothetical protein EFA69_14495 [Rufibacter immobilis]
MRYWLLAFLLALSPFDGLQRIARRNLYVQQAQEAYARKQYQQAAVLYERVRQAEDETPAHSVLLNLAHSYFHLHEYSRASPLYRALLDTKDRGLLSIVTTQLSVIEAEEGNFTKAIAFSKQALKADETNKAARYNYELLQKYLLLHPELQQTPPPPQRRNQRQSGSGRTQRDKAAGTPTGNGAEQASSAGGANNATGGGAENKTSGGASERQQNFGNNAGQNQGLSNRGDQDSNEAAGNQRSNQLGQEQDLLLQTRAERLKQLQLSPEKARQLLDAMRQEEAQYLQQLPRRSSRQKNKDLPDW